LGERVLEEASVCSAHDVAVVWIKLYMHDLLMMGDGYSDGGEK
jgi:hypothetical protein